MDQSPYQLLKVNRDAVAVNRGFYFQYLQTLYRWVVNYVDGDSQKIYVEVGDDIKEVGEKLVFTQIKCYSGTLSLQSKEIHKALFNFFTVYLEEKDGLPELRFDFETNTVITPNERLLNNWINGQPISDELLAICTKKITEILIAQIKKSRDQRLSKSNLSTQAKLNIKKKYHELTESLTKDLFEDFVRRISWKFGGLNPEASILALQQKIVALLNHEKFEGKSPQSLLEAFLSEIYHCSQRTDKDQRFIDNNTVAAILSRKSEEFERQINQKLLPLMDLRFSAVYQAIGEIQELQKEILNTQAKHSHDILKLKAEVVSELIPKYISLPPPVDISQTFGRTEDLSQLKELLNSNQTVAITGHGGMGKSTLAKLYLNDVDEAFDHIIWLEADSGFLSSFSLNEDVNLYLDLDLYQSSAEEQKINRIIRKLSSISGNNISPPVPLVKF